MHINYWDSDDTFKRTVSFGPRRKTTHISRHLKGEKEQAMRRWGENIQAKERLSAEALRQECAFRNTKAASKAEDE